MNTCWRSPAKVAGSARHAIRKRCRYSAPSMGPPVEESVAVSGIFERGQLVIEPWLEDPMPDYECGI